MCFFSPIRNDPKKHTSTTFWHSPSPGTIPQICLRLCVFLSLYTQGQEGNGTAHTDIKIMAAEGTLLAALWHLVLPIHVRSEVERFQSWFGNALQGIANVVVLPSRPQEVETDLRLANKLQAHLSWVCHCAQGPTTWTVRPSQDFIFAPTPPKPCRLHPPLPMTPGRLPTRQTSPAPPARMVCLLNRATPSMLSSCCQQRPFPCGTFASLQGHEIILDITETKYSNESSWEMRSTHQDVIGMKRSVNVAFTAVSWHFHLAHHCFTIQCVLGGPLTAASSLRATTSHFEKDVLLT